MKNTLKLLSVVVLMSLSACTADTLPLPADPAAVQEASKYNCEPTVLGACYTRYKGEVSQAEADSYVEDVQHVLRTLLDLPSVQSVHYNPMTGTLVMESAAGDRIRHNQLQFAVELFLRKRIKLETVVTKSYDMGYILASRNVPSNNGGNSRYNALRDYLRDVAIVTSDASKAFKSFPYSERNFWGSNVATL